MASVAVEKQELERKFERRFEDAGKDSAPDFSKMSVDDLKNYSAVLNREIAELDETAAMLHYFDAVNRAVLDGARVAGGHRAQGGREEDRGRFCFHELGALPWSCSISCCA